jgi:hypothetical protein
MFGYDEVSEVVGKTPLDHRDTASARQTTKPGRNPAEDSRSTYTYFCPEFSTEVEKT